MLDRAYGSFGGNNKQDRRINLSIKEELTSNNNEGKKLLHEFSHINFIFAYSLHVPV